MTCGCPKKWRSPCGPCGALEEQHGADSPLLVHTDLRVVDTDLEELDASTGMALRPAITRNSASI